MGAVCCPVECLVVLDTNRSFLLGTGAYLFGLFHDQAAGERISVYQ
jgi:hypothetical protein